MEFWGTAIILVAVAAGLVALIRKNLEQRDLSRRLRTIFISEANDLVGKPEFPSAHAQMLVSMAGFPEGWVTRFFVANLVRRLLIGRSDRVTSGPKMEQVPFNLRKKYVLAMLSFALSDSYRSVIFGHIFRATNSWLTEAIKEPKGDISAHATQTVIEQVSQASVKRSTHKESEMAAAY